MSRLRQLRAFEYGSSNAIQTEFESIVRYLQNAEVAGQTLSETMAKLTDDSGNLSASVQLRNNASSGIQYRVGEYTDAEAGWTTIVPTSEIRGPAGTVIGEIGAPIFNSRVDYTVVSQASNPVDNTEVVIGATVINYSHLETDELLVYNQGILLQETNDYTTDHNGNSGTGTVSLLSAATSNDSYTIYKVRSTAITNFRRLDATHPTGSASNLDFVSFDLTDSTQILVYVGGVLYREPDDYSRDSANDRVVFNSNQGPQPGTNYSIITVENADVQTVTGIMMESAYTDSTTGLIQFNKLDIDDGVITQPKVQNLQTDLAARAKLFVSTPTSAELASGDVNDAFYKRTVSGSTEVVYYDGTNSIVLNPSSSLPTASATDVNKVVTVDQVGSYVLSNVDLSGLISTDQKGTGNGVAQLNDGAKIVFSQYDFSGSNNLLNGFSGGPNVDIMLSSSQVDGTYRVQRFFGQNFKIVGLELRCGAGSCNVQLDKSGTGVGAAYVVGQTASIVDLGTSFIGMDARSASIELNIIVTGASNLADLEVVFKTELVAN